VPAVFEEVAQLEAVVDLAITRLFLVRILRTVAQDRDLRQAQRTLPVPGNFVMQSTTPVGKAASDGV
jgi:hypothetical protein